MKRVLVIIICFLLVVLCTGCTGEKSLPAPAIVYNYIPEVIYLNDREYIKVQLPDNLDYATDNKSYIDSTDGTVEIVVYSELIGDTLAEALNISNSQNQASNLVITKPKEDMLAWEIGYRFLENKALRIRCTEERSYDAILQGLGDIAIMQSELGVLQLPSNSAELKGIPNPISTTDFDISMNFDTAGQFKYRFGSSYLTLSTSNVTMEEAVQELNYRLTTTISGTLAEQIHVTDNIYYAEAGSYTIAVYKYNYNTVAILYGRGDVARDGVRYWLLNQ